MNVERESIVKKIVSFFLCITLIFSLCSCKSEEGKIVKQDYIAKEERIEENDAQFQKLENDLGIEFEEFKSYYANLKMPVPKDFDLNIKNDNYIELFSNKYLKDSNIKIMFDLRNLGSREYENIPNASFSINQFEENLKNANYTIEGKSDYKEYSLNLSHSVEVPFSNSYEEYIHKVIIDRCDIKDPYTSERPEGKFSSLKYYIIWDNHPMVISGVSKKEDLKTFEKMLDYMVSNMEKPDKIKTSFKNVSLNDLSFTIPIDYKVKRENTLKGSKKGVEYIAPINEGSKFSGTAFSIYEYKEKEWNKINKEYLEKNVIHSLFKNTLLEDPSDFLVSYYAYEKEKKTLGKLDADKYLCWTTVEEAYPKKVSYFDNAEDICHDVYKVKKSNKYYLVVLSYPMKSSSIINKVTKNLNF